MLHSRLLRLTAAVVLAGTGAAWAQSATVRIPRVDGPPVLDRYLDGTAVPPGVRVTDFRQREPGDGVPVSQPTAAYLSYDDQHFYAVFICADTEGKVRANLTRREAMMSDDFVGLILDTYHDGRRAYLFYANPLGIQMDGAATEGQDDDYSYDTLWRSEGRLTANGYAVLIAVPFKSLRFGREPRQTWGVLVARSIPRNNETSFWPYVTKRIASAGQQMAALEGLEGVSPGRNLNAIPYASFAAARFLDPEGARIEDATGRIGLDAKAVIRDAMTLDLTVNPDFSQVESDEPQVTINKRFEVFFPEKRPFFIENAGYFDTPQQLFFSRRIVDPGVGVRVTGRSRGWAFGGLAVTDEQPGRLVPEVDPSRDKVAAIGVVRLRREFARQSHVGAILEDREFGRSANRVVGIDGRWRLDDNWSITGQWVGSRTSGEDDGTRAGNAVLASVSHRSRTFDYESSYEQRSPEFEAELGYIPRVDLRQTEHEVGYSWYPANSPALRASASVEAGALWDYGGELQDWTVEPGVEVELPGKTELDLRHWTEQERFEGQNFRRHSTMLGASSEWLSWLAVEGNYRWGTAINYYPAPGLAPFMGDFDDVEAGVTLRPGTQLRLDERYIFSRLAATGDDVPAGDVFNNHIIRSRASYQFTRELSGRLIVDYEAVLPNAQLVSLERQKRLHIDLLGTYLVNPWTAVYVGYTDGYENLVLGEPLVRGGDPTTSVGRQVFVKISYLLKY